ncbi:hypothetical protein GQ600_18849 [Phytophthora cactorum]|nr:hypothetical protein GQ600_18849 [Phytophthora cactorum]
MTCTMCASAKPHSMRSARQWFRLQSAVACQDADLPGSQDRHYERAWQALLRSKSESEDSDYGAQRLFIHAMTRENLTPSYSTCNDPKV